MVNTWLLGSLKDWPALAEGGGGVGGRMRGNFVP